MLKVEKLELFKKKQKTISSRVFQTGKLTFLSENTLLAIGNNA